MLEIGAAFALVLSVGSAWLTLSQQSDADSIVPSSQTSFLLIGTLIPAMALLVLLGRRLAIRRAAGSTARLHVRLVFLFSLIAAIPTLLVAGFASFLFQTGANFWFSDQSRGILENADQLARGYYQENLRDVANETIPMANDLRAYLVQASIASPEFADGYARQVLNRKFNESAILQRSADGVLTIAAAVDPQNDLEGLQIDPAMLGQLENGELVAVDAADDRIEAVAAIDREAGIYLYNSRLSDGLGLASAQRAQSVVEAYDTLSKRSRTLQLRFNLALFFVPLALVGFAVWFALRFADRQVEPLTDLVAAARRVGAGNYALRVAGRTGSDEIGLLNRAFNRMTAQIEKQTDALVGANQQLGDRRAFIEAVLESVSAGVVSVDEEGRVQLMNSSAQALLLDAPGPVPFDTFLAELSAPLSAMLEDGRESGIVQLQREGELLSLAVTVARATNGAVITFEDITRQLLDQRQAAWSDVARRIAHEIKNPLTPIQLATERLRRRYGRQIEKDAELFEELTGTIVRQVGELRRMVDEFSSFARLPEPVFRQEDATDLARQALFLQEVARPDIDFGFRAPDRELLSCDRHQFGQAVANILKNATEAIEARSKNAEADYRGKVQLALAGGESHLEVTVTDNGIGLPQGGERIVEPYVTTREKGTGLGLAIVNKIVEEHGGDMAFAPRSDGETGTVVTLRFALDPASARSGRNVDVGDMAR